MRKTQGFPLELYFQNLLIMISLPLFTPSWSSLSVQQTNSDDFVLRYINTDMPT